ncbi:ATP-grasp domain-containing protein [Nonomuraea sp. NPDC050790]|uniref:ATP-grasp domain-containing protein n=1 Tax=Nonomuraea sp. NPDC050790 TaxID=3364371 RepID=UPI0037A6A8D3
MSRRRHLARTRKYAEEHGHRVIMIMKDPEWEADYVDEVVVADTSSIDETLSAAKDVAAAQSAPIDAVVTFAEAAVPSAARVAAEFGLPGVSERTAHLARDKYLMRAAFAEGGVAQPRFALAGSLEEAVKAAGEVGFPMVLKPIIGTGSMYVRSVATQEELEEHFDVIREGAWAGFTYDPLHDSAMRSYRGGVLAEQFVPGPEICVESVVVAGRTHVLAIHDKPLPTGPTFEEVYACTPTRLPAETVERIGAAVRDVHAAMGILTGPTHVEFRLAGGVEPVVLEAAARMGGGPIYRSVLLSTGVDMVEAALDLALGRTPELAPRENPRPIGFWNIFPERAGTLSEIAGLERAAADPRVDEVEIYRRLGDHLEVPPRTFQGHGHLIFKVGDVDELDPVFDELVRTLRLRTDPEGR